jgi:hypothetical protein
VVYQSSLNWFYFRTGELLDDSGKAVGYTDGINANNKKIPDKLV